VRLVPVRPAPRSIWRNLGWVAPVALTLIISTSCANSPPPQGPPLAQGPPLTQGPPPVPASKPVAQLPQVYLDTTWNPPTGGTTWAVHTAAQLANAIANSVPGDTIVLDAGVTYVGSFQLPAKSNPNNNWIYVMSSAIANLPPGTRVSPANVPSMATIVTTGVAAAFQVNGGANHWRFAGLEITSASTQGCNLTHTPPINCFSYFLIGSQSNPTPLPDSITIDR